jgi:hypothetical protein
MLQSEKAITNVLENWIRRRFTRVLKSVVPVGSLQRYVGYEQFVIRHA